MHFSYNGGAYDSPSHNSLQGGTGPVPFVSQGGTAIAQPKCFRYGLHVGMLLWAFSN